MPLSSHILRTSLKNRASTASKISRAVKKGSEASAPTSITILPAHENVVTKTTRWEAKKTQAQLTKPVSLLKSVTQAFGNGVFIGTPIYSLTSLNKSRIQEGLNELSFECIKNFSVDNLLVFGEVGMSHIGFYLSCFGFYYRIFSSEEKTVETIAAEVDKIVMQVNDFTEEKIKPSYDRAYSCIKKREYRLNASEVRKLEVGAQSIVNNIDYLINRLEQKKKKTTAQLMLPSLYERCCNKIKSAQQAKFKLLSNLNIATAILFCQTKEHRKAFDMLEISFQYALDAISIDKPFNPELRKLLPPIFELIQKKSPDLLQDFFDSHGDQLRELVEVFQSSNFTGWTSDLWTQLTYASFDSFDNADQQSDIMYLPILFARIAIEVNPSNYLAHNNLGYAYARLNNFMQAREHLTRSVELGNTFPLSRYNLVNLNIAEYFRILNSIESLNNNQDRSKNPHVSYKVPDRYQKQFSNVLNELDSVGKMIDSHFEAAEDEKTNDKIAEPDARLLNNVRVLYSQLRDNRYHEVPDNLEFSTLAQDEMQYLDNPLSMSIYKIFQPKKAYKNPFSKALDWISPPIIQDDENHETVRHTQKY